MPGLEGVDAGILEALRRPELIDEVRRIYQGFSDAVQEELDRIGADRTEPLARVVFAALDGLALQQLITGDAERTREAVERLQSLIRADIAVARLGDALDGR